MSALIRILQCCVLTFLLYSSVLAQTGALEGVVSDQSGVVVAGATVKLTHSSGRETSTSSAQDGHYGFIGLLPGDYRIQAFAPSLATPEPLRVLVGPSGWTVNIHLRIVLATQNIAVQENAGTAVNTDPSSNASATILRERDLDALADDANDLASDLQALAGPSAGPNGGQVYIDGFSGGDLPSKDSIREIRINQNPFSPEFERLGLGRIEMVTKPGTDKFRGSAFYNFAHDAWNSRNPYASEKALFFLQEWGGNLGGPISRRASFFVDTRRDATDNGSIVNAVTLDPVTFRPAPFTDVFEVRQRGIRISPRIDYQLNSVHSLTFRYALTKLDIPGAGVGSFNLRSGAFDASTSNQTLQAGDTAVIGSNLINELRFQFFRTNFKEAHI